MARLLAPGEVITQQEWERFQLETGGPQRSAVVRSPTKAEADTGIDFEQHPIYRYFLSDGESYVEMQQNEKGDYTVIDFKPSRSLQAQQNPSANETVPAPATNEWIVTRRPDGTLDPQKNPNYKGPETEKPKVITSKHDDKTGVTNVLVEMPDGTRKWDTITGGPTEAPAQPTTSTQREPVPGFPGVYIVKAGTKDAKGNTVSSTYYENEAGERVQQPQKPDPPTMIGGKPHRLNPTTGNYEPIKIEGATAGSPPDIADSDAQFGQISTRLRQRVKTSADKARARIEAGEDSSTVMADFQREVETGHKLATSQVAEIGSVAQEQRLIQSGERGEAQSRRSWADNVFKNANQMVDPNARRTGPTVAQDYTDALMGSIRMQEAFTRGIGGFNSPERTSLQNDILNITMPNGMKISMAGNAAAPGGGATPDLGSTMSAGLPGGVPRTPDFATPMWEGGGMNTASGHLAAPGFSEGMQAPYDFGVLDGVGDDNDPDWQNAVSQVRTNFGA